MAGSEPELGMLSEYVRYLVAAGVLAALWTAESLVPMFEARRRRISHGAANFGLALINGMASYGAALSVLYVTELSYTREFGLLHRLDMPEWLHGVLAIVLFDVWQYGWHRLNHRVPFLWRFHAVHHSDAELDVTSGVRFHTVEILLSTGVRLLILPAIGMTVVELLIYESIALPIILFHHSNVRLGNSVDRLLRWLIVTPWMHWVHHSRWRPETDSNYSSFLSVWDRLFGSFRLRAEPKSIELGLDGWSEEERRSLWGTLVAPFRRRPPRDGVGGEVPEKEVS